MTPELQLALQLARTCWDLFRRTHSLPLLARSAPKNVALQRHARRVQDIPSTGACPDVKHATAFPDSFRQCVDCTGNFWEAWFDGCRHTAVFLLKDSTQLFRGDLVDGSGSRIPRFSLQTSQLNNSGRHAVQMLTPRYGGKTRQSSKISEAISNSTQEIPRHVTLRKLLKYKTQGRHPYPVPKCRYSKPVISHAEAARQAVFSARTHSGRPRADTITPGSERHFDESCLFERKACRYERHNDESA